MIAPVEANSHRSYTQKSEKSLFFKIGRIAFLILAIVASPLHAEPSSISIARDKITHLPSLPSSPLLQLALLCRKGGNKVEANQKADGFVATLKNGSREDVFKALFEIHGTLVKGLNPQESLEISPFLVQLFSDLKEGILQMESEGNVDPLAPAALLLKEFREKQPFAQGNDITAKVLASAFLRHYGYNHPLSFTSSSNDGSSSPEGWVEALYATLGTA